MSARRGEPRGSDGLPRAGSRRAGSVSRGREVDEMGSRRLPLRWRAIAAVVITIAGTLRWHVHVEGMDHVPRRGGVVLTFNHHSYLDFVMVAWPLVRQLRRPVCFLAKREIWASRWTGWAVRLVGAVPVDRDSSRARAGALQAAVTALRDGECVVVAPEQTISPSFEILPLRTGAVRMAQQSGVPIVPVLGWGTHRVYTKGRRPHPRPGLAICVRFGEPLHVGGDDDVVEVTRVLQHRMSEVLHEVQEAYPQGAPAGAWWVPARLGGGAEPHTDVLRRRENRSSDVRDDEKR